jgi:hypothetical protein
MMGDFYESSHLEDTELDGRIMSKWSVEKLERGRGLDISGSLSGSVTELNLWSLSAIWCN